MKGINFLIIAMLNVVLVISGVRAESTEDKVERILQNIAVLETEIKHLGVDLDQNIKPKLKSVDEHRRTLGSIKINLEFMRKEISSIRASSDQTDKRLVELNESLTSMMVDTKGLYSEMKGELRSSRLWLQIIVGGIVVGIIIILIQIILQRQKPGGS